MFLKLVYETDYLPRIRHPAALCDRCVDHIYGTWYRCANCDTDLCEDCEQMSIHDPTHVFLMIKSVVDMGKFRYVSRHVCLSIALI